MLEEYKLYVSITDINIKVIFFFLNKSANLFGVPDKGSANPTPLGCEDDFDVV